MVFNATFNYISAISWQSVLLVEETRVLGENHQPAASHWQIYMNCIAKSRTILTSLTKCIWNVHEMFPNLYEIYTCMEYILNIHEMYVKSRTIFMSLTKCIWNTYEYLLTPLDISWYLYLVEPEMFCFKKYSHDFLKGWYWIIKGDIET